MTTVSVTATCINPVTYMKGNHQNSSCGSHDKHAVKKFIISGLQNSGGLKVINVLLIVASWNSSSSVENTYSE